MKVLIHDLSSEEWDRIKDKYADYKVISNNGNIKSCVGCFGCWVKNPGKCVIEDSYDNMPALLAHSEKVLIISRITWGGFSSFVKNVFDRNIGYMLPFIKKFGSESHHSKRYEEPLNIEVIFYGENITDKIKQDSLKYVTAVCTNLHANLINVDFIEGKDLEVKDSEVDKTEGIVLLNCSYKGEKSNSNSILTKLKSIYKEPLETYNLISFENKQDELISILSKTKVIVLAMPLYVDGVPSRVVSLMERLYVENKGSDKIIYVVSNLGFFESKQIVNLLKITRNWAEACGYKYGGGLAIGGGEMVGPMINSIPTGKGPVRTIDQNLIVFTDAIKNRKIIDDLYANPNLIHRVTFNAIANSRWRRQLKGNGLNKEEIYRKL